MATHQPAALPEHTIGKHDHPEPHTMCWSELELAAIKRYAEAYALAALQSQPAAAGVSDEEILRAVLAAGGAQYGEEDRYIDIEVGELYEAVRAILALRPQAVPMTDEQNRKRAIAESAVEVLCPRCEMKVISNCGSISGKCPIPNIYEHGITAQGAQGEQA